MLSDGMVEAPILFPHRSIMANDVVGSHRELHHNAVQGEKNVEDVV